VQHSSKFSGLELGGIDAYIKSKGPAFAFGLSFDAKEGDGRGHTVDLELPLAFF
jgi:hypothetical protein